MLSEPNERAHRQVLPTTLHALQILHGDVQNFRELLLRERVSPSELGDPEPKNALGGVRHALRVGNLAPDKP